MRVLVTRVQPQAARWVDWLAQRGQDAVALPLIEVAGLVNTAALAAIWQRLANYRAVMFVSSHAVNFFFAAKPARLSGASVGDNPTTRFWATGPGTRAELLRQGLDGAWVDAPPADAGQFDSEILWHQVKHQVQAGTHVLIVRGSTAQADSTDATVAATAGIGRDWLAQRLRDAGAVVDFVVAYQRGAPAWLAGERALAQAASADGSLWLFSSAEAVANLHGLLPTQAWSNACALATHARIAAAVRALGFGRVYQARPTLESVLASIESMA